jgi:ribonuclease BN (tRNA processing enzyme)
VLGGEALPPLPVYAPPGALDAVLALDRPGMLADGFALHDVNPGSSLGIGPFDVRTRLLPHSLPNAGARLAAGGHVLAYTGDTGPDDGVVDLARGADLLLAEASFIDQVPGDSRRTLSSAHVQGQQAAAAGTGRLILTHLLPGTDPAAARAAAERGYRGEVGVATPDLVVDL